MKDYGIINNTIETANPNNMTEKETTIMTTKTSNKAIICIDTNETFGSVKEAAKHLNLNANSISGMLTGKVKSVKGMHFRYADSNEAVHCNSIVCVETGKTYKNQTEAAKDIGCTGHMISGVLRGKYKSAKGFHFKYINSTEVTPIEAKPEAPINPDIPKEIIVQHKAVVKGKGKRMNGNTKAVFDFTTGAFYTSGVDAAEIIGTTQGNISRVCNSRGRKANGHKICYVRNIPEHLDEIGNAIRKANMYDDLMTKEEKRNELLTNLKSLESKADNITYEISRLLEELADTEKEIEKAKDELINFGIN